MTQTTLSPHTLAWPNLLTLGRILAVPLIVISLLLLDGVAARWVAFTLFVVASATDWLDGYMARMLKQQSKLGRMLDPIADKLLVAAALTLLVHDNTIAGANVVAALVILCREILVSGLREFLSELQIRVQVTALAKLKTAVQMTAIAILILAPALPAWTVAGHVGLALLWIAAVLTLWTGYGYLRAGIQHAINE